MPVHHQKTIKQKKIRVYFVDMVKIAREVASVADLQMRMQGIVLLGAFLKLTPYAKESDMTDTAHHQRNAPSGQKLRNWVKERGLLLANIGLFLVFFGGMIFSGAAENLVPFTRGDREVEAGLVAANAFTAAELDGGFCR